MKFPRLVHNRLSYMGLAIAVLSVLVFLFLSALMVFAPVGKNPYAGIVVFALLPTILFFGLLLVPIGMGIEWLRWRRRGELSIRRFPIIDLNDPRHRNATLVFAMGTAIVVLVATVAGYRTYQVTESVAFCGLLCHSVMKPEYTTYEQSPHARVACVDCHVGPGAGWFVRSKISGVPQIYYTLTASYPRPIPTPVKDLRPAQETCEHCHWPKAFFGGQQHKSIHFLPDKGNTRWEYNMLIKTGGGSPDTSLTEGIHWHMSISNRLEYIATDEQLQHITWVRITDLKKGKTREYSYGAPLSKEEIAKAKIHRLDCIDCHNRPTHIFRPPSYSVNLALSKGDLDMNLPYVKREAVRVLAASYDSEQYAVKAIQTELMSFYTEKYPAVAKAKAMQISTAIAEVQRIYRGNEFPAMKVRWDTHPDNIGHFISPGCFRCHDGGHRSVDGRVITRNCNTCHIFLSEGKPGSIAYATQPEGIGFQHPVDIDDAWKDTLCYECHTGSVVE